MRMETIAKPMSNTNFRRIAGELKKALTEQDQLELPGFPIIPCPESFGARLSSRRKIKKLTQEGLSMSARISMGRLSKLERGVSEAKLSEVAKLSKCLGVCNAWLAFGE